MHLPEALFFAKVAQQAYSFQNDIRLPDGLEVLRFIADDTTNATAFVAANEKNVIISIKGTDSLKDVVADAQVIKTLHKFGDGKSYKCHSGFLQDYLALRDDVRLAAAMALASTSGRALWITGHSLGAGIATLLAFDMALSGMRPTVYTFGSPRVADWAFSKAYKKIVPDTFRIAHDKDIVVRIPKLFYYHVDRLIHIDDRGIRISKIKSFFGFLKGLLKVAASDLDGEAVTDHFIDNYIKALEEGLKRELKPA